MLRLIRFLWTGDWRLPEWEIVEQQVVTRRGDGSVCGFIYVQRDGVTGKIRTFSVMYKDAEAGIVTRGE